jgi:hypothetical protein
VNAELWNRVIENWRRSGVNIRSGVSNDEIAAFESKYGVVMPNEVREYFMTADGTGDDMDEGMYRFWPLAEVKPVHEELRDENPDRWAYPDCVVFADHCISCWDYAIRLTSQPDQSAPVFRVTGSDPAGEQMAASFREFMKRYADDPDNII